ncbi:ABC transporter substrate-binding protein [Algibacillus agarilyticus]|uniref:ABC transporter substrate-binding protein n=1 Tax=Algibacillus agarilyticus TaxID=2234133 RepID=UPI000DD09E79|nr:ABC transporter substrate-binding protein [Algibacillus agarilyticus]
MNNVYRLINSAFLLIAFSSLSFEAYAVDSVKRLKPILSYDKRAKHKDEVIRSALEASVPKFGQYEFVEVNVDMTTGRALQEIHNGDLINIFIAPASPEWESKSIAIKTPIRQGLLSYRLLVTLEEHLPLFANIKTLEQLSRLSAGLQHSWVTDDVYKIHNLNVVYGNEFEGLFLMLKKKRFHYIPRAVYEAYDELKQRRSLIPNAVIEPNIALYIPMATYIYVSRNAPQIATRINHGLQEITRNGQLKAIFDRYYAEDVKRARLHERTIIRIDNPNFNENDIINKALLHTIN